MAYYSLNGRCSRCNRDYPDSEKHAQNTKRQEMANELIAMKKVVDDKKARAAEEYKLAKDELEQVNFLIQESRRAIAALTRDSTFDTEKGRITYDLRQAVNEINRGPKEVKELDNMGLVVPVAYSGTTNQGCNRRHWLAFQPDVAAILSQIRNEEFKDLVLYLERLCLHMTKVCDNLDRASSSAIYVLAKNDPCPCESIYRMPPIHVIKSCLLNHEGNMECKKQKLESELHKLHKENTMAQKDVQNIDMAMVANIRSVRSFAGASRVCECMDNSIHSALWETNYKSYP